MHRSVVKCVCPALGPPGLSRSSMPRCSALRKSAMHLFLPVDSHRPAPPPLRPIAGARHSPQQDTTPPPGPCECFALAASNTPPIGRVTPRSLTLSATKCQDEGSPSLCIHTLQYPISPVTGINGAGTPLIRSGICTIFRCTSPWIPPAPKEKS